MQRERMFSNENEILLSYFGLKEKSTFSLNAMVAYIKEGVLLRNISPSLVLSDHFPGGGIVELGNRSGKE